MSGSGGVERRLVKSGHVEHRCHRCRKWSRWGLITDGAPTRYMTTQNVPPNCYTCPECLDVLESQEDEVAS
jgi:hypothetical protein